MSVWGIDLEARVPEGMVTEQAKRQAGVWLGLEMPPYCEFQPRPCGCKRCPRALRQTRVTEPVTDYFVCGQDGFVRSTCNYRCGVCGDVHTLNFVQKFSKNAFLKEEGEGTL